MDVSWCSVRTGRTLFIPVLVSDSAGQLILASGARQTCRKELLSLIWLVEGRVSSLGWDSATATEQFLLPDKEK